MFVIANKSVDRTNVIASGVLNTNEMMEGYRQCMESPIVSTISYM